MTSSPRWRQSTAEDWMALAQRTLRGRDLAELVGTTRDGIEVHPLYTGGPAPPPAVRAADPQRAELGWDIRQSHRIDSQRSSGRDAMDSLGRRIDDDLAGGAVSLELDLSDGVTIEGLERVLSGVDLAQTPVALAPHSALASAEALRELAARRSVPLAAGSLLGLDPAGEWARSAHRVEGATAAAWAAKAASSDVLGPGVRAFTVDATRYVDAGATEAQALGWATATGVAYLRALVDAGLTVDAASGLIGFRLAATADQFVTIAALRAARVMWSRVVTASGGSDDAAQQYQHAVTASCMYSRSDPWVNLLRGSAAALAAGVAGADAVTVLPFDHACDPADSDGAQGRRLARNTQLLLLQESHLSRAADPAGGSFYVETVTDELARAGWRILQQVEEAGGIDAVAADGSLQRAIETRWQQRLDALSTRREPLIGVSEFPLLDDAGQSGDVGDDRVPRGRGLPVRRLAQPFEDLRDAADRHRVANGTRPAVWVAALGSAADHSARTSWVQNLLAVGGIEARGAEGVDSPIAAAADFAASGLAVAVITGTDDMYSQRAVATAAALGDAGASFVALVCDPGTDAGRLEKLRSAGVDEFWHSDIDAVATLKRLHSSLGLS